MNLNAFAIEFPLDPHLVDVTASAKWAEMTHVQKRHFGAFQVAKAKARGLIEPSPCVLCACDITEAHHPSYERPNRIVWLCRRHHRIEHLSNPEFVARVNESKQLTKSGARIPDRVSFRIDGKLRSMRIGQEMRRATVIYAKEKGVSLTSVLLSVLRSFLQQEGYLQ